MITTNPKSPLAELNRTPERFLQDRRAAPQKTLTIGAIPHSFDGSSYYRVWLPFKHLADNSRHITGVADPKHGGQISPQEAEPFDVLTLQRPAGRHGTQLLERLVGQTKLVYETDDDMFNVDPSGLPHLATDQARESIRRCLRLCDMVTTTNQHIAEVYQAVVPDIPVVILPNFVKADLLTLQRPKREKTVIGWAGGTSHLWDMMSIQNVLRDVLEDEAGVEAHFVGFDFSPIAGRDCRWTPWEPDVGHYYKNIDFDIAIAPSADRVFNRSKTPIRTLEMAALGIPVVASNRLPYSEFVQDGKTGFLVNDYNEWRKRLHDLIHDQAMRDELGANAKEQARAHTIEGNWQLWEAAYERAANA